MKHVNWILALVLALVMAVISPMQVLAVSSQVTYISEIQIGYGDSGKAALEQAGYTVWTNLNANEGGNGSAVWLGYQTTNNADEAITDIALMNMKGGYSFDAYTEEVQKLNQQVTQQLQSFAASIAEFQANYQNGNPFAIQALEVMNNFYDDDSLDSNGEFCLVGDLLLDETTPEETLHRIFLEGNTQAIVAIEQALALACIETGDDTILTRLADAEYPDQLSSSLNQARTNLKEAFPDFRSSAASIQELYEQAETYEGGIDGFLAQETLSDAEKYAYATKLAQYTLLANSDFGNGGMTLLDFALLDEEEENEAGEVLEDEYLEMLAQSMTAGQLGLVANVGIMTILCNAAAGVDPDTATNTYQAFNTNTDIDETISVYYEVDRSLFSDTDSIALTSDALREKAAAENSNFGRDSGADKTKAIVLTSLAAVALAAGSIATSIGVHAIVTTFYDKLGATSMALPAEEVLEVAENGVEAVVEIAGRASTGSVSAAGVITSVLGVVAIIAGVILTIFAILEWLEKPKTVRVEYTKIPRAIVEKPTGERSFITYYAAGLAGAAEGETDSLALYGDLNALNGSDEWLALYYSKDAAVGTPLTTELLVMETGTLNVSDTSRYSPVHMFGSAAAANLNQYNTNKSAKNIYVFFRNDGSAIGQAGSVFTTGSVTLSIVTFLVGAGLATAITFGLMRKKKAPSSAV